MSDKRTGTKNVVVVGAGFAGAAVARELSTKLDSSVYNLIVVNARPFLIHLLAGARMIVSATDHLEDTAVIPYDKFLPAGKGSVKVGKVTAIVEAAAGKGGEVVLEDGEKIPYVALVLATGSTWAGPLAFPDKEADLRSHLTQWRSKFEKAKHVVIVGGGAVGIEFSGEIKEVSPTKKVTIVHSEAKLLNDAYPDKFRDDIERRARARGVDFILGDKLDVPPEGTVGVTTQKGKSISDADLVIPAFGPRPNASFISSLGPNVVTERNTVRVDEYLQVPGHPGVFAAGDIIDYPEQKQATKANNHVKVVVANVISFIENKPLKKAYKGSPDMILIPLGKTGGSGFLGFLWGILVGNWFAKTLKGKDLMIPAARTSLGY
ncbi:FAD/NAD-P-binding domain-containing protein [Lenzites betulinus]|nr:FAD/NAD-P-binding domain-containing protein [Lenzites betulinus]